MNVLAFDIETIPDVNGGRRLLGLPEELSDADVAEAMFAKRREKTGSDFIATHLQKVVAISPFTGIVIKTNFRCGPSELSKALKQRSCRTFLLVSTNIRQP